MVYAVYRTIAVVGNVEDGFIWGTSLIEVPVDYKLFAVENNFCDMISGRVRTERGENVH